MAGSWIEITAQDGGKFKAYVAVPRTGHGPGIVLCQEIFGLNGFIREVADYYAEEGYTVVAPDLFWRIKPGIELGYTEADWAKAFEYFQAFDTDKGMQDITATVKAMRTMPQVKGKVGALGFCLGGRLAYLAAARAGVDCAVGYYGVTIDQYLGEAGNIKVPLALHFAGNDKYAPPEAVEKIRAAFAGNDLVDIYGYPGVDHAFARTGGMHYDKPSALMAHHRSIAVFRRAMGPHYDFSTLWDKHCEYEFGTRDVDATMATMVPQPYVNHIPTMTGGVGFQHLRRFYKNHFIPTTPKDTRLVPISRTIGEGIVVDEMLFCFTPRHRGRLDAPGHPAHRQVRRDPAGGDRQVPWRQALQRAHLLGPGERAGADRQARSEGPSGGGRRDSPQAGRRDVAVEHADDPVGGERRGRGLTK